MANSTRNMKIFQTRLFAMLLLMYCTACNQPAKTKTQQKDNLAATDTSVVKLQLVTTGTELPVEIKLSPDNSDRKFITDLNGRIWIMKGDSLLPKPFLDLSAKNLKKNKDSQLGKIVSLAFHPQYATNGKFYVFNTAATSVHENPCKAVVSEFTASKANADIADIASERSVIEIEGYNIASNAAEIAFGPDGYLYISVGDDAVGDSAYMYKGQNLNALNGKMLRIDINQTPYAIPADNPFLNVKNSRPEIWACGFRKVWRFCFSAETNELFGADVGELKAEEIDIIKKGGNYGWPYKEGDSIFRKQDSTAGEIYTAPVNAYDHKHGICIIGGNFYYGDSISCLKNRYVFADFNGAMFTLMKNEEASWIRQPLKFKNKPADPFLICGCDIINNNEVYVMGLLNTKDGSKGVVYKIVKG